MKPLGELGLWAADYFVCLVPSKVQGTIDQKTGKTRKWEGHRTIPKAPMFQY